MTVQPDGYQPAQAPPWPTAPGAPVPPVPQAGPGSAQVFRVRLTKVTSVVVFTQQQHAFYTGTLAQLERTARSVMTHNLLLGWWGIPFGLIWTPMALVRNGKALKQLRALATGQPG